MKGALYAKVLSRLRRHMGFNILKMMKRPLGEAVSVTSSCPGLECRALPMDEVLSLCGDPALELKEDWVRDAYKRGGLCLGAFSNGRLVGYNWLAYEPTRYTAGVWLEFGPSCRYSYKTFVRPENRGQRIAQALHRYADDPALRRGRSFALNFVNSDNYASVAAVERSGSRCAGYVVIWQALGKVLAFATPGAKQCGVRFYGSHRPRVMRLLRLKLGLNLCKVLVRDLPDQSEPKVVRGILEYRMMDEAELIPWCADAELGLSESSLRQAFSRGDQCVGAFDGAKLVGYVFFAFQAAPETRGIWVDFDPRARYAYKSFVLPAYRGRRMGLEMYALAPQACPSRDRSYSITIVHTDNVPSLRAVQSIGGRAVGYVGYLQWRGLFFSFRSPGARRHGMKFFRPAAFASFLGAKAGNLPT